MPPKRKRQSKAGRPRKTPRASSPDSSCHIDKLPDELLLDILRCLTYPDRSTTLCNAALVSKKWNRVAEDCLCERLNPNQYGDGFFRKLLAQPELQSRVKELHRVSGDGISSRPSATESRRFRQSIKRFKAPKGIKDEWKAAFEGTSSSEHVLMNLILLHSPNVEVINFRSFSYHPEGTASTPSFAYAKLVLPTEEAVFIRPTFHALRVLQLDVYESQLKAVMEVMKLPKLRRLEVGIWPSPNEPTQHGVNVIPLLTVQRIDWGAQQPSSYSGVNQLKIIIQRTTTARGCEQPLILACRALRSLELQYPDSHHFLVPKQLAAEVGKSLLQHAHSLQYLQLHFVHNFLFYDDPTMIAFSAQLQGFTKLDTLVIPFVFRSEDDQYPENLLDEQDADSAVGILTRKPMNLLATLPPSITSLEFDLPQGLDKNLFTFAMMAFLELMHKYPKTHPNLWGLTITQSQADQQHSEIPYQEPLLWFTKDDDGREEQFAGHALDYDITRTLLEYMSHDMPHRFWSLSEWFGERACDAIEIGFQGYGEKWAEKYGGTMRPMAGRPSEDDSDSDPEDY